MSSTALMPIPDGAPERRQARRTARSIELAKFEGQQVAAQFESVGQAAFVGLSMLNGLAAVEGHLVEQHPESERRARAIVDSYTGFVCTSIALLSARR